jgi:hypothetical protein
MGSSIEVQQLRFSIPGFSQRRTLLALTSICVVTPGVTKRLAKFIKAVAAQSWTWEEIDLVYSSGAQHKQLLR